MVAAATQRMDTHAVACGVEAGKALSKSTFVQSAHIIDHFSFEHSWCYGGDSWSLIVIIYFHL